MNNNCKKGGTISALFASFLNWLLPKPSFFILSQNEYGGADNFGSQLIKKFEDLPEGVPGFNIPLSIFEEFYMVLLNLGTKSTGGYSIEIVEVQRCGCTLNIYYTTKGPSKGQPVTDALSNPYCLAAIPKFNKINCIEKE
jgi:hypothetical protein